MYSACREVGARRSSYCAYLSSETRRSEEAERNGLFVFRRQGVSCFFFWPWEDASGARHGLLRRVDRRTPRSRRDLLGGLLALVPEEDAARPCFRLGFLSFGLRQDRSLFDKAFSAERRPRIDVSTHDARRSAPLESSPPSRAPSALERANAALLRVPTTSFCSSQRALFALSRARALSRF